MFINGAFRAGVRRRRRRSRRRVKYTVADKTREFFPLRRGEDIVAAITGPRV